MKGRRNAAVLMAIPLVAAACGSTHKAATGGSAAASASFPTSHTLSLSFLQDPGQPPDPDVYYAGEGLLLTRNLYEGLVTYQSGTASRNIVPALATDWTISPDGLTYTFHLRQGVKFHDGTDFTSAAIEPSFKRRAAVNGGPAYMVSGVSGVQTPDPYTAVITLSQKNTAFLDYLAAAYGPAMMSPTALAANAGSDNDQTYLQTHDIGTGPYTLTQAQVGVSYQLTAFPGYWGAKPYYTTVDLPVIDNLSTEEIKFDNGQIAGILHDLTTSAAVQYQHSSKVKFYNLPVLENETVYVNENKGPFTSQDFRKAFIGAINVPAIVAAVFPGGRASIPKQVGPDHLIDTQYALQHVTYDPGALKKLVDGLSAADRNITLGYDTGAPDDQLIAEQIGAELQSVGLTAKVVGYQTSSIYSWPGNASSTSGPSTPNVLVDYFWPDADTPYTWTHINFDPTGGLQYMNCNVPGVADLDTQAVTSGDLTLFDKVAGMAQASGCWLNVADKNDAMVFQPWMKGVPDAHVVATPEALMLSKLYPG